MLRKIICFAMLAVSANAFARYNGFEPREMLVDIDIYRNDYNHCASDRLFNALQNHIEDGGFWSGLGFAMSHCAGIDEFYALSGHVDNIYAIAAEVIAAQDLAAQQNQQPLIVDIVEDIFEL
jgi:hypothetical protein